MGFVIVFHREGCYGCYECIKPLLFHAKPNHNLVLSALTGHLDARHARQYQSRKQGRK